MIMILFFKKLASTHEYARKIAPSMKGKGRLTLVAQEQTDGIGRQNSQWISTKGDLAVTWIVEQKPPKALDLALKLAWALEKKSGPLFIKWPNDLWNQEGKIAGLLIEQLQGFSLISLGINRVSAPRVDYGTSTLKNYGYFELLKVVEKALFEDPLEKPTAPLLWLGLKVSVGDLVGTFMGVGPSGEARLTLLDGSLESVFAGSMRLLPSEEKRDRESL